MRLRSVQAWPALGFFFGSGSCLLVEPERFEKTLASLDVLDLSLTTCNVLFDGAAFLADD